MDDTNLFQRPGSDTWYVRFTPRGGKLKRISLGTSNIKEARRRADEIIQAAWEGRLIEKAGKKTKSLQEVFDDLWAVHWSNTKDRDGVRGRFDTLLRFVPGDTDITLIDRERVNTLIKDMKLATYSRSAADGAKKYPYSIATINRVLALLGYILHQMEDAKLIPAAPRLPKATETRRTRFLSEEEEAAMFNALAEHPDHRYYRCLGLFEFLVDTGCRMGEAFAIHWRDYNPTLAQVLLTDTKSGKDVLKPLTERAQAVLEYERGLDVSSPFDGITEFVYRSAWLYAKDRAGLGWDRSLVRHSLRHTAASRMIQRGVDISGVRAVLGHESALTTQRYAHLADQHKRSAVAVLGGVPKRIRAVTG